MKKEKNVPLLQDDEELLWRVTAMNSSTADPALHFVVLMSDFIEALDTKISRLTTELKELKKDIKRATYWSRNQRAMHKALGDITLPNRAEISE